MVNEFASVGEVRTKNVVYDVDGTITMRKFFDGVDRAVDISYHRRQRLREQRGRPIGTALEDLESFGIK